MRFKLFQGGRDMAVERRDRWDSDVFEGLRRDLELHPEPEPDYAPTPPTIQGLAGRLDDITAQKEVHREALRGLDEEECEVKAELQRQVDHARNYLAEVELRAKPATESAPDIGAPLEEPR